MDRYASWTANIIDTSISLTSLTEHFRSTTEVILAVAAVAGPQTGILAVAAMLKTVGVLVRQASALLRDLSTLSSDWNAWRNRLPPVLAVALSRPPAEAPTTCSALRHRSARRRRGNGRRS